MRRDNQGIPHCGHGDRKHCAISHILSILTNIVLSCHFYSWIDYKHCVYVFPPWKCSLRWTRAQWAPSSTTPMPGTGGTRSCRSEWFLQRSTTRAFLSCMVLGAPCSTAMWWYTISNPKPKWHFERPCIAKDRLQPPSEQDNVGEEELTTSTSPPKATKEKPDSAEVRFQHYDKRHIYSGMPKKS